MTGSEMTSGPVHLLPVGLERGPLAGDLVNAGRALLLAGGPIAFQALDMVVRGRDAVLVQRVAVPEIGRIALADLETRIDRLTRPRHSFAAINPSDGPHLMGIVNTTPDSFSDGSDNLDPQVAIAHGRRLREEGASILDVGGESTRPGSEPVPIEVEIARTEPVVRGLAAQAPVSIDSRNAAVMARALDSGAALVNDISALRHDPAAPDLVAARGCPVAVMHMAGEPRTMQADPRYDHAPTEVYEMLADRVAACEAAGIPRERILVDPGFGFGKTVAHNMAVTDWLALYHGLGCPILFGASRKSSIAALSRGEPAKARGPGSIALALAAAERGAQVIRVHDVADSAQALVVWRGLAAW